MTDRVLIPLPGIGTLVLSDEAYKAALAAGAALASPSPATASDEPLLDAPQLAEALSIPVTWVEQKAREGLIPSIRAGRWRRFSRASVERALAANGN